MSLLINKTHFFNCGNTLMKDFGKKRINSQIFTSYNIHFVNVKITEWNIFLNNVNTQFKKNIISKGNLLKRNSTLHPLNRLEFNFFT